MDMPDALDVLFRDVESSRRRFLQAETIFFLTGPGYEKTKISDGPTLGFYREAANQLDKELRLLEGQPEPSQMRVRRQTLRQKRALIGRNIKLPRVLTLTAIEKLYEFWSYDLDSDPNAYIFADLFLADAIAHIGNGDTMRVLEEFLKGKAPSCAYPNGIPPKDSPRSTVYGESASSPDQYNSKNRKRYWGVFTDTMLTIAEKALRYNLIQEVPGREGVAVAHAFCGVVRETNRFDYVFDETGLERESIERLLPPNDFFMRNIEDQQRNVLGRRDERLELYILGTAANLPFSDLPTGLQTIIRELEIPENTISLWLNALLTERWAYTFAATHPPTRPRPQVNQFDFLGAGER